MVLGTRLIHMLFNDENPVLINWAIKQNAIDILKKKIKDSNISSILTNTTACLTGIFRVEKDKTEKFVKGLRFFIQDKQI